MKHNTGFFERVYANEFENLCEIHKFLEKLNLPKLARRNTKFDYANKY